MRRFAVSDIHGCIRTFDALLDQIGLSTADELYLLGDYVDRGPDSKAVIDRIWQLRAEGYPVTCLMGNHEEMMLNSLLDGEWFDLWLVNGGRPTLQSFGVEHPLGIPSEYTSFALNLLFYCEVGDYLLVHAGLNFAGNDPLADRSGMMWIRDWYGDIDYDWLNGRIILHGHTPIGRKNIEFMWRRLGEFPVLDIDGGCVFAGRGRRLGYLCAFDMTNRQLYFQENIE